MKGAKYLGVILASMFLMSSVFSAVNLTATVGNQAPTVGEIKICDGTCAYTKAIAPATAFTVQVAVTDPNGQSDVNATGFALYLYTTADTSGSSEDWDMVKLDAGEVSTGTADGCTEAGSTYCLAFGGGDWTTKFLKAGADVYVIAKDNTGATDNNEAVNFITVSASVGSSQDATTATYSGDPDSTNNAMTTSEALAYIITTHNGNSDLNVTCAMSALQKGGDEMVSQQMHWDNEGTPAGTPFDGDPNPVQTDWSRGTDPTSATFNLYTWLNVPADQPAGEYTGTFTFASAEA